MMGGVRLLPRGFRPLLLALSAVLLVGWFSPEISDPDFWWHLKTGQYILEKHSLPVPDPFAYTTAMARPAYAGEARTRDFNLTHEWLAQALFYLIYRAAGFGGLVLFRAAVLAAFCALAGLLAWRRCSGFYGALAATFATAGVASGFAVDRPYLFTFLLLAATIAILETRRWMWLLPPLFPIWANCHGGYFLGWVVVAAYSIEALFQKSPNARRLWIAGAVAVLASGVNPNGFRILQILLYYRGSYLTSRLLEWASPRLWPPGEFAVLLFGAAALLLWARRRVRLVDWLLFLAFAVAALSAQRNTFLIGFLAPVLIASYFPWKPRLPVFAEYAAAALVVGALAVGIARGSFFQLRAAEWKYPAGAADFLLAQHVTGPLFNTYEYGGYLMWRLWPRERVFIDGRALSESVFMDYARILYNHDESGGKSAQELQDDYGVQAIVMNGFQYSNGLVYLLAPSLADPGQKAWTLVYSDPQAMVFLRKPPEGVAPMDSHQVLDNMEQECDLHIRMEPRYPRCARGLAQVFSKVGELTRARRWLGVYLSGPHDKDAEAEQAYTQLVQMGK